MFNESVKLKWKGEEYECVITMGLIKEMERSGINILKTAIDIDKPGIPLVSIVSELYSHLLRAGGCDVTEEDVYISIMSAPQDAVELTNAAKHAISFFFPALESSERPGNKAAKKK